MVAQKKAMPEVARRLSVLTCTLQKLTNELESEFTSNLNLTPSEFHFLSHLHLVEDLTIKNISEVMSISYGRISHILNSLENKGFVKRENNAKDKRNVVIKLTDKTKSTIAKANDNYLKMHSDILGMMENDHKDSLVGSLENYLGSIRNYMKTK